MDLEIIYQDQYLLAINKPHGLLVHRSSIARDATENALNLLVFCLLGGLFLITNIIIEEWKFSAEYLILIS